MRLWLDDVRDPAKWAPEGTYGEPWVWAFTGEEAIDYLMSLHGKARVTEISFDHDLGDIGMYTGYDVAKFIEEYAYKGYLSRLKWSIHSANPVGRKNIQAAMKKAEEYWDRNEALAGHNLEMDFNE